MIRNVLVNSEHRSMEVVSILEKKLSFVHCSRYKCKSWRSFVVGWYWYVL